MLAYIIAYLHLHRLYAIATASISWLLRELHDFFMLLAFSGNLRLSRCAIELRVGRLRR